MENRKRALNLGALFENAVLRVRIQWDGRKSLFTSFLRLLKIGRVKSPETTGPSLKTPDPKDRAADIIGCHYFLNAHQYVGFLGSGLQYGEAIGVRGLERIRFHDLRHTFSVLALQNGVDVKTLSSMLGHYSAGFTLDTYAHVTSSMQKQAANAVGSFLSGALR